MFEQTINKSRLTEFNMSKAWIAIVLQCVNRWSTNRLPEINMSKNRIAIMIQYLNNWSTNNIAYYLNLTCVEKVNSAHVLCVRTTDRQIAYLNRTCRKNELFTRYNVWTNEKKIGYRNVTYVEKANCFQGTMCEPMIKNIAYLNLTCRKRKLTIS